MVLFFVATLVFFGLHRLTEGEGAAVTAGAQFAALAVIVGMALLVVRRMR